MMTNRHAIQIGGRVALAGVLLVALAAFAIALDEEAGAQRVENASAPSIVEGPLEAELRWCRHLGDEALQDKACLKAWEENRARFMKYAPKKSPLRAPAGH